MTHSGVGQRDWRRWCRLLRSLEQILSETSAHAQEKAAKAAAAAEAMYIPPPPNKYRMTFAKNLEFTVAKGDMVVSHASKLSTSKYAHGEDQAVLVGFMVACIKVKL